MSKRLIGNFRFILILCGICFYAYYGIYKMVFVHFDIVGVDFLKGYYAAENFLEGRSIYLPHGTLNPFFYPPLSVLIYIPFTLVDPQTAIAIWFIFGHILVLFSAYFLSKYCNAGSTRRAASAAIIAFGFSMPLYQTIIAGNMNLLIFAVFALIYFLLFQNKTYCIAPLVSAISYLKIYPAILALTLLRKGTYRAFAFFLFSSSVLGILSLSVFGFGEHVFYINHLPSLGKYVATYQAMSLTYAIRLFFPNIASIELILVNLLFLSALLFVWKYTFSQANNSMNIMPYAVPDLFILTTIMLLVIPSSWLMYHAFFVFPFYFILLLWFDGGADFKAMHLFFLLFGLINFWEILSYHFPISFDLLTIHDVGLQKESYPNLHPVLSLLPFCFTLVFLGWLLSNYRAMGLAVFSLQDRRDRFQMPIAGMNHGW